MDGLPATLADPNAVDYVPELIVVGATSARGDRMWSGTNTDAKKGLPHVYTSGEGFKCPEIHVQSRDGYRSSVGTSPGKHMLYAFLNRPLNRGLPMLCLTR